MGPEIIQEIYSIAKQVYEIVQDVKALKEQSTALSSRIESLMASSKALNELAKKKKFVSALRSLRDCLNGCRDFLVQFKDAHIIWKIVNRGGFANEFEDLNKHLRLVIEQLQLDINVQQLFNQEDDQKALQADLKALARYDKKILSLNFKQDKKLAMLCDAEQQRALREKKVDAVLAEFQRQAEVRQVRSLDEIDQRFRLLYHELQEDHIVAQGSFATVYYGFHNDQTVAIKKLDRDISDADQKLFIREVTILTQLQHDNVVSFRGACFDAGNACIVMAYMKKGSLFNVLRGYFLTESRQKQLVFDIASGLEYLHSQKVIHSDFRSGSVLVDENFHAALSDYGLSNSASSLVLSVDKTSGNYPWMAPEYLSSGNATKASDIYSLGVVIWEIITAKIPSKVEKFDSVQAPELPAVFLQMVHECCHQNPQMRASLLGLLDRVTQYQPPSESDISAQLFYERGIEHEKAARFEAAFVEFKEAAKKDHGASYTHIAGFFRQGQGVEKDQARAVHHYRAAAELGHARGAHNYAMAQKTSDHTGQSKNPSCALFYFRQAQSAGFPLAKAEVEKLEAKIAL